MAEHHAPKKYDPFTGITEEWWYDDIDNKVHIRRTQKVDNLYKDNIYKQHTNGKTFSNDDGIYLKARLPNGLIEEWYKKGINWFHLSPQERKKLLNQHPETHVKKGRL